MLKKASVFMVGSIILLGLSEVLDRLKYDGYTFLLSCGWLITVTFLLAMLCMLISLGLLIADRAGSMKNEDSAPWLRWLLLLQAILLFVWTLVTVANYI